MSPLVYETHAPGKAKLSFNNSKRSIPNIRQSLRNFGHQGPSSHETIAWRTEDNDRYRPDWQILLINHVAVHGHQDLKTIFRNLSQ